MFKNSKIIALFSAIAWLAFAFAAFKGFHFWYAGFVFFFWLCLAALNYRRQTTLWCLKNRLKVFLRFYLILLTIGFIADFIIGQRIAHLWAYPYYDSLDDWIRNYFISYPFGGLAVLELLFFLSNMFREKFTFKHRKETLATRIVDISGRIADLFLVFIIIGLPALYWLGKDLPFGHIVWYSFMAWVIAATIGFIYHVRHGFHWLAIMLITLGMSVFVTEIPNTAAWEWEYYDASMLNFRVLDIPFWVFVGWYVIILVMVQVWVRFMRSKKTI